MESGLMAQPNIDMDKPTAIRRNPDLTEKQKHDLAYVLLERAAITARLALVAILFALAIGGAWLVEQAKADPAHVGIGTAYHATKAPAKPKPKHKPSRPKHHAPP